MNFSEALDRIYLGRVMARKGWNGANQTIQAQFPDEHSKMTRPYIYITTTSGDVIPWLASQGDMFANDWVEVL